VTEDAEPTLSHIADRLAIRELFDAYAHCADRRDAEGQKALFTEDTRFAVYMDGEGSEPTYVLEGREALTPVFEDLNRYEVTTHFNGQSTVAIDGDRATGESYTIAHHLFSEDGERKSWSPRSATLTRSSRLMVVGASPSGSSSSTGARRDRRVPGPDPRRRHFLASAALAITEE
jgi:SnoaL-like domain